MRRSLEESLERLGLDRVDIALVHDPEAHLDEALQEALPERSPIDEERFGAQAVKHARAILRRQGLPATPERVAPPADETKPLKEFDQYVLTAIYLLRGEGYAVSITDKVDEMMGKENLIASTFVALSRLEGRGLVESREKEAQPRRYYTVTPAGERVLANCKGVVRVWIDSLENPI